MPGERWSAGESRQIRRRIVVTGMLIAQTPLHLGNGDRHEALDAPLLRDTDTGRPLLRGSALAGVLRSYLRACEFGDRVAVSWQAERDSDTVALFGGLRGDDTGLQSPLLVDDALGTLPTDATAEIRDGVRIEPTTSTAADKGKFDIEVWPAGTTFPLRLELVLTGEPGGDGRLQGALASALAGLRGDIGYITLGARVRRGYGRVTVEQWRVQDYDLTDLTGPSGLLTWLTQWPERYDPGQGTGADKDIRQLLGGTPVGDKRRALHISLTCALKGSMLIHSNYETGAEGADRSHIHSRGPNGARRPVLPGTSLAGALRARAERIAHTIAVPDSLVECLFGAAPRTEEDALFASRLLLSEQVIRQEPADLVQTHVAIDRLTGGAYPGALYAELPVFAEPQGETLVTLEMLLVNPEDAVVGLLLLTLKDLWLGDLPIGSKPGRGWFEGRRAELSLRPATNTTPSWRLERPTHTQSTVTGADARVTCAGEATKLEHYVTELLKQCGRSTA